MYRAGTADEKTMRHFDESCLAVPPIEPKQIKKLRQRHKVSQSVFARYLSTSESTIEKWESGAKNPAAWPSNCSPSSRSTAWKCSPSRLTAPV
jgi:putative transcriptional regulator